MIIDYSFRAFFVAAALAMSIFMFNLSSDFALFLSICFFVGGIIYAIHTLLLLGKGK